jgi:sulfur-oxidizing protein SoxY
MTTHRRICLQRQTVALTRRATLALSAAHVAVLALPSGAAAESQPGPGPRTTNGSARLIGSFTAGRAPITAKVTLELPEIAENGNTVPLVVRVDSPMTAASHVTDLLIVADGNPSGRVALLHFTPLSGVAEAALRIRLAMTQTVTAIAKTNTGELFAASQLVKVTIGGCGG